MAHETKFSDGSDITSYLASGCVEGFEPRDNIGDTIKAWSFLIGTRVAFSLQGWYGRTASNLIDRGIITNDGTVNWDLVDQIINDSE